MANENETENTGKEAAGDVAQDAKEVAGAAGKWASGDKVGAVKDALKLAGRKIKDFFNNPMKAIKKYLIMYGIPTIAALLIPILFFAVIFETANAIKEAVVKIAKTVWTWLGNIFTGDGIKVSNEAVDELINSLSDQGIYLEDLGLAAKDGDMTDEDYNDDDKDGVISEAEKASSKARKYIKKFIIASLITQTPNTNNGGIEGGITLKRVNPDIGTTIMGYAKNIEGLPNAFTMDESNRIVYNARVDDGTYTQRTLDISAYEQYSLPVMFFIDICLSTQCPEYALALANEIINSEKPWMTISIMDSYTEVTGTETVITTPYENGQAQQSTKSINNIGNQRYYTTNICVTEVNHLFFHLEQTYERTVSESTYNERTEGPYKIDDNGTSYKIVDKTISEESVQYGFTTPVQQEVVFYYNENDIFYKLTKKEYKTSENIKASAYDLLLDGGDMMFELMDANLDNEFLCQVFKYILYKMSGHDFGVTELEGSLFDLNSFTNVSRIYGNTIVEKIWFALLDAGISKEAAAGVLANLEAESNLRTNNLEDSYESKLGMTDESYTEAVNNGAYSSDQFINDSAGYGLAQWTYYTRKRGLYLYAKSKGVSIDDENMQIEYLFGEMGISSLADGFATNQLVDRNGCTVEGWKNAKTPEEAAEQFCWIFENPGTPHMDVRKKNAQNYYSKLKDLQPGGDFTAEGYADYVIGTFTSLLTGRTFTIFNQMKINGWKTNCNRAAQASVCSGYINAEQALNLSAQAPSADVDASGCPRYVPLYNAAGLTYNDLGTPPGGTYPAQNIKAQLLGKGYLIVYLRSGNAFGKSGRQWTWNNPHWIAIIGYRENGGVEEIFVSDSANGGTGWQLLNEFDGILTDVILVNEK